MKRFLDLLSQFARHCGGNFATTLAVALPAMFGGIALSTDYVVLHGKKSELQEIADAAALAAAKERLVTKGNQAYFNEIVNAYVDANYKPENGEGKMATVSAKATITEDPFTIKVTIEERWTPFFAHMLQTGVTPVVSEAKARLAGQGFVCVVGLMDYKTLSAIHLDQRSRLEAPGCGIYSNSPSRTGLRADNQAVVRANSICSAGGYYQHRGAADVTPRPITDCPKIEDPLSSRHGPPVGKCNHRNLVVSSNTTLKPGTYCNGLKIIGEAEVTFEPGVYVIKNGPLEVEDEAQIVGKSVGFFLTGPNALFNFAKQTRIDLTAPKTGPLAGVLFFEDRKSGYSFRRFDPLRPWDVLDENGKNVPNDGVRIHVISSNYARNLLGTFYLPNSILLINSEATVADKSAYTAIVTARLWLREGPTLVLNSDYKSTAVPVPADLLKDTVVLTD